jgi:hypothetical protein
MACSFGFGAQFGLIAGQELYGVLALVRHEKDDLTQ